MTTHVQVLIVGAGISGLVCAHALCKSGITTLLVESASRPGGVIRSERRDGFLLELGPQSFSTTPQLLDLCRELNIENELLSAPHRAPRFLLINGKLRQAPLSPPAFLVSSLFSFRTKWRIFRDAFGHTTPPDTDESVAAFTRRKFTPELLDRIVGPFVSGIYAGDPEQLSLRAAFPQLYEAERSAGGVIRGLRRTAKTKSGPKQRPTLQTFRDGNETLLKTLAAKLGPSLRTGTCITEICRTTTGRPLQENRQANYEVTLTSANSSEKLTAENVVLATPADAAATLLRGLRPELSSTLSTIHYAPIAVVSLGYPHDHVGHSLNGFGFLVPRSAGLRTLGTVWNSSLFSGRAPNGQVLLTSFIGGATDPEAVTLSPEALASLVHKEISPLLQIQSAPLLSNVTLYPRALPQYNLGHSQRIAAVEELTREFPGLWLLGNYLRGPSIGTCIEEALAAADEIHARATVRADRSP